MAWEIRLTPAASKELDKLGHQIRKRILSALGRLSDDPRSSSNVKKVLNQPVNVYRFRVGDYRVLYTLEDRRLIILVVRVGHRGTVYKRLSEL